MIYTDRSRIETDQVCGRLRAYEYEWEGRGVALESTEQMDIGSCVHAGAGAALALNMGAIVPAEGATDPSVLQVALAGARSAPEWAALTEDAQKVVDAVVRTWWAVVLPQLVGWKIVEVEREEAFDYNIEDRDGSDNILAHHQIRLLSRLDLLAEAPEGAVLNGAPVAPGLYQFDWKTCRKADDRWASDQLYNQQWVSQLLGVEKRLGVKLEGTVVVGLAKEAHPLLGGWRSPSGGEVRTRYSWQCDSSHINDHTKKGGMCPGGKYHRLGDDWQLVPPDDPAAWFEQMRRDDPTLLAEQVRILGPIRRASEYEIESWLEETMPREAEIAAVRSAEPFDEATLRRVFPKRRINCTRWGRKCAAFDICFGGQSLEGMAVRVPNHLEERGDD